MEGVADGGDTYDGLAWAMLVLCMRGFMVCLRCGWLATATVGKVRAAGAKSVVGSAGVAGAAAAVVRQPTGDGARCRAGWSVAGQPVRSTRTAGGG